MTENIMSNAYTCIMSKILNIGRVKCRVFKIHLNLKKSYIYIYIYGLIYVNQTKNL